MLKVYASYEEAFAAMVWYQQQKGRYLRKFEIRHANESLEGEARILVGVA